MRRDKDRDLRDNADFGDEPNRNNRPMEDSNGPAEMQLRALWLLDEIIRMTPRSDVRQGYLMALREQLETDEAMMGEAQKVLAEFEEAYTKLTAPANKIGVYLGIPAPDKKPKPKRRFGQKAEEEKPENYVRIALGDQEYITNVDPKLENPEFKIGTQVKVNEAFAVVGDLGFAEGGPIVKISETAGRRAPARFDGLAGDAVADRVPGRAADRRNAQSRGRSPHGTEFQGGAGAFRRQRDQRLLYGGSPHSALVENRRAGRGDYRDSGRYRTSPALPGTLRAVRQAPAERRSAVRPSPAAAKR